MPSASRGIGPVSRCKAALNFVSFPLKFAEAGTIILRYELNTSAVNFQNIDLGEIYLIPLMVNSVMLRLLISCQVGHYEN